MLLRQMRYFVAVVESGSFTEAAEHCYISQSAVSQQIAALEGELGVKLLLREGRKFTLTPAGEYFYGRSAALLREAEQISAETVRIGTEGVSLRVGYLSGYDGQELQNALAEFSRTYPEAAVTAFRGSHEELYAALRSGGADLVFSDQRRAFSDEYENYLLCQGAAYIELPAAHPLAARGCVRASEIAQLPCILVAAKGEEETERAFYRDTLGVGRRFLFAASLEEARLLAVSGRGFLPVESARKEAQPPFARLEVRRDDGSPVVRTYCAFWQKRRTDYYIEEFAASLRKMFN